VKPRHLLALTAIAALALTGCGDNTQQEALEAAGASCPHGAASIEFQDDGTTNLRQVVCR